MALFSGAVVRDRVMAFVFPLLALLTGDFFVGFHILMPVVYLSFVISTAIGFWLRERRSVARLGGTVLLGAIQFFLITNLGVWMFLNTYPKTFAGLMVCYAAGVPFFWNTLAGDACYSALLFGGLFLAERTYPALRPNVSALKSQYDFDYGHAAVLSPRSSIIVSISLKRRGAGLAGASMKKEFALDPGGPKRLTVTYPGNLANAEVLLDGQRVIPVEGRGLS